MPELHYLELQRLREWIRTHGPANCWTGTSGSVAATMLALLQDYERRHKPQGGEGLALKFETPRFIRYVLWDTISGLDLELLHPTIEAARAHALELDAPGEERQMGILKIDCDLEYVADVLPSEPDAIDPQGLLFTEASP